MHGAAVSVSVQFTKSCLRSALMQMSRASHTHIHTHTQTHVQESVVFPATGSGVLSGAQLPAFELSSLVESTNFPDTINRLTLNLRSNLPFLMPEALTITVGGLLGSQTLENTAFPLLADGASESRIYECAGELSCIIDIDTTPSQVPEHTTFPQNACSVCPFTQV
jgi:hypothetical protein